MPTNNFDENALILTHSNTFLQPLTVIWLKFLNIDDI